MTSRLETGKSATFSCSVTTTTAVVYSKGMRNKSMNESYLTDSSFSACLAMAASCSSLYLGTKVFPRFTPASNFTFSSLHVREIYLKTKTTEKVVLNRFRIYV